MKAGRFVGRVGGLAVALGVGVAIANSPAVAWAEDGNSTGADSTPSSTSTDGAATSTGTASTTGSQKKSTSKSPTASTDSPARTAPTGSAVSTGGAQSSTTAAPTAQKRVTKKQHQQNDPATGTVQLTPMADSVAPPDNPKTPSDAPVGLALLAVGTRSRTEEQTFAAAAAVTTNSAPKVPVQPMGSPDPVTGVVTGTVIASDPENNPLTYGAATTPASGTVRVNPQTGAYTYTPTEAARLLAATTPTVDTDSFTVAVSDGEQTTTAPVSVFISPIRFDNQSPIPVGTTPSAVVVSADGRMFVVNTGSKTVSVINTVTGQRIDANPSYYSKDIPVGSSPSAVALSADGTRLYVANTGSGTVSVIDTSTYKRIDANPSSTSRDIKVGSSPSALALSVDGRLYVANRGSNTVSVIDTATNRLIDVNSAAAGTQSIPVGTAPTALALAPDGRLYVANSGNGSVSVVDTRNFNVTNTFTVGAKPTSMTLGGRFLYVTNSGSGTVSVIDTTANTVGANPISVGSTPSSVALNPDGSLIYVANANDTVSVIDRATNTLVRSVAFDTDATGGHVIAVAPNGTIYVTDAADKTVRVLTVHYGNTAPVTGTPTVGTPNTGNGAVAGTLNFVDADGNTLSYKVTQPSAGNVTVTAAGGYTFTPTLTARKAAAAGGPTTTTFTVKATDGQATAAVNVTVPITAPTPATTVSVMGSVSVTGDAPPAQPVLSADGTRAVIITPVTNSSTLAKTTRVVVINTVTGKQVGSTVTLTGSGGTPVFSGDGTRILITTSVPNTTTGIDSTRVTVIDTATGARTGTTLTVAGSPAGIQMVGADGSRALITTDVYDVYDWDGSVTHSTGVAMVDTTNGTGIGVPLYLAGGLKSVQLLGADQVRAQITTSDNNGGSSLVTTVDTVTGTQVGSTVTVPDAPTVVNTATNHAVVLTRTYDNLYDTSTYTTRVTVVDTSTGTAVGQPIDLIGDGQSPVLSADGRYALVTATVSDYGESWNVNTTRIALIDIASGAQTGKTITLAGAATPQFSADGTRVAITTRERDRITGVESSQVMVVESATGDPIGSPLTLPPASLRFLSRDGSRALLTTSSYDPKTVSTTMHWAVLDTTTGARTSGTTLTLHGYLSSGSSSFSEDGSQVLISTSTYDDLGHFATTYVTSINTDTGAQIGTTVTLNGYPVGYPSPTVSGDGTRAVITTNPRDYRTGADTTQVAVINTATGNQVGSTLTFTGYPANTVLLGPEGNLAMVTVGSGNSTRVVVIDTITGKQTGTFTVTGAPRGSLLLSADGTRALLPTAVYTSLTSVTTRVTVLRII